jgi:uncharacterized protein YneF (UPF0154 family)
MSLRMALIRTRVRITQRTRGDNPPANSHKVRVIWGQMANEVLK